MVSSRGTIISNGSHEVNMSRASYHLYCRCPHFLLFLLLLLYILLCSSPDELFSVVRFNHMTLFCSSQIQNRDIPLQIPVPTR